jgi:hypothetical protein
LSRTFAITVLLAGAAGCAGAPTPVDQASGRWAAAKTTCGTYSYLRVSQSGFGSRWATAVEITADVPSRRHFTATNVQIPQEWDESGAEVGTHQAAFAAETVEGLLAECETILGADPARYTFFSTFDDRGFPRSCIQTEKGAADDASSGIAIEKFACAPLDARGVVVEPSGDAAQP